LNRVVIDTNVVVSALLHPNGHPAQTLKLSFSNSVQLCVSASIFAEYEEVIRRPRFQLSRQTIAETLAAIKEASLWVHKTDEVRACSDPDDNIFLECAQTAGAAWLVTGNLKHFPSHWGLTRVLAPREFVDLLSARA
jgi:uncharacterized protein